MGFLLVWWSSKNIWTNQTAKNWIFLPIIWFTSSCVANMWLWTPYSDMISVIWSVCERVMRKYWVLVLEERTTTTQQLTGTSADALSSPASSLFRDDGPSVTDISCIFLYVIGDFVFSATCYTEWQCMNQARDTIQAGRAQCETSTFESFWRTFFIQVVAVEIISYFYCATVYYFVFSVWNLLFCVLGNREEIVTNWKNSISTTR